MYCEMTSRESDINNFWDQYSGVWAHIAGDQNAISEARALRKDFRLSF